MSLDRDQDMVTENVDEDEDMPPLVDNPNPAYTFFSGMTPLSFTSHSAHTATQGISPQPSTSFISSPPASRPHGKRRDPSYIPRPPNAFILFRCAFIKEQNVPGKVEGNHSRLSKIIGLCWKQLSPEEREKWEAKAVLAQTEHRAHYPDWRFRPGANAMAKLKVKDGGGPVPTRRRSARSRTKDPPTTGDGGEDDFVVSDAKGKAKERGKGKTKSTHLLSLEETRCAKIAGFVAEGIKGDELEVAVKEWEGDHRVPKPTPKATKAKGRGGQGTSSHARSRSDVSSAAPSASRSTKHAPSEDTTLTVTHISRTPSLDSSSKADSPDNRHDIALSADPSASPALPDVPLTHMFKRSLSAPASNKRLPYLQSSSELSDSPSDEVSPTSEEPSPGTWGTFKPLVLQAAPTRTHSHSRRDTISFPMPSNASTGTFDSPHHLTWQEAENQRRREEVQEPDSWWTQRQPAIDPQFVYSQSREQQRPISLSTDGMGYDVPRGGSQFDRGYIEQYGSFEAAQDGSQAVEWTDLSSTSGRQGLVTVIEDPYKDDCDNNSPSSVSSPPTLTLPPLSSSSYYQSRIPPPTPPSVPSSSFSTLTGWAGDYKYHTSDARTWPPDQAPNTSSLSSGWYGNDGTTSWGSDRPELQRPHLSMDSEDWDHVEYRAASNLHLPVEPPRQLDFMGELRRLHGSSN
ncbi:hypothetical protein GALMADRAFT_255628 [Galerina marginata CBS 339.88]|uniref:HMG box domain-containing protein n=1 Tax=Galerina marginata (strain CBS 339.88) TaxID=685588 RepID=A0A067SFY3_GALM3|nr:hypothetical protein GALMADRAFT_255628 [Galerina marginata CBS 339.88]